jgi:hypothetical protein
MRKSVYLFGDDPWVKEVKINNKTVKAPTETYNYAVYDDKVIFLLCGKEIDGQNVWCYLDDGSLLWKIEESPRSIEWHKDQKKKDPSYMTKLRKIYVELKKTLGISVYDPDAKDYYTDIIYIEAEDKLYVRVRAGIYDLDPDTGKVSNFEYDGGR